MIDKDILRVDNNFPLQNYLAGSLGIISAVAPHLIIFKYIIKRKKSYCFFNNLSISLVAFRILLSTSPETKT